MKTTITLAFASLAVAAPHIDRRQTSQTIPGRWIAILHETHEPSDVVARIQSLSFADGAQSAAVSNFGSRHEYSLDGFKGFAFDGDDDLLNVLSSVDSIASIHPDGISHSLDSSKQVNCNNGFCTTISCNNGVCTTLGGTPPPNTPLPPTTPKSTNLVTTLTTATSPQTSAASSAAPSPTGAPIPGNLVFQENAPWGLGRISHRAPGSVTYAYNSSAGSGATVYIIDTGLNTAHVDFEGRASLGPSFVSGVSNVDGAGHGTHCAGTVGSKTYGVAKKVKLVGIKVLNDQGNGQNSDIIAGIQWAVKDAQSNNRAATSVISLSIGGAYDSASNAAVAAAIKAGIFVSVAAGNDNADSSKYSPASESTVCTIGAIDDSDAKASFSNYGQGVDVFAPGVNVLSTWIGSDTATRQLSGTSMATPHVAGLAAYLLIAEGQRGPQDLCSRIASIGTRNKITGLPSGTINSIAYNDDGL